MNKLQYSHNPYLLQHAHNPVDWYPWCEEAFEKARQEDKPIFLSIGYSTCHWCHVMEKESFNNLEVAKLLNRSFICIKVDREERPDLDAIYMSYCQAMRGNGGWPLTIIMTPEKEPFFAATYIPREDQAKQLGLISLISAVEQLWRLHREQVLNSATEITTALKRLMAPRPNTGGLSKEDMDNIFYALKQHYDPEHGGFGTQPKFPLPQNLLFLLQYGKRNQIPLAYEMFTRTLVEMRKGGIFDQIGYGFHRYSTDRSWSIPHFEKMLYDQAFLSIAYLRGYQVTGEWEFRLTAEQILQYVLESLQSPEGAFFSAEDADVGQAEGEFYLWKRDELKSLLKEPSFWHNYFALEYIEESPFSAHASRPDFILPHLQLSPAEFAKKMKLTPEQFQASWEHKRTELISLRDRKRKPFRDEKILTDWNSMMIQAFTEAFLILQKKSYLNHALKAMTFLEKHLVDHRGNLRHSYFRNTSGDRGFLDDYAYFIQALLKLYQATMEESYLWQALQFAEKAVQRFWSEKLGGFYFTQEEKDLIIRPLELYDGAYPSGNSIMAYNLFWLSWIYDKEDFREILQRLLSSYQVQIRRKPSLFAALALALDLELNGAREIIIAGHPQDATFQQFRDIVSRAYLPDSFILYACDENSDFPVLKSYFTGDETTVFICSRDGCEAPIRDSRILEQRLQRL